MKSPMAYACYNTNKEIRLSSSSGAIFSSLAEWVLKRQGVVYGVTMSEDCYSAEFISVTRREDLAKLRGSKYLQAKVGNTYKAVKSDLLSGKMILFSGTGCQVNGLRGFLGKEYDNLICVDVICHGAPSPALWREYAEYQERKNNGKLKCVNFRCKDNSWVDFGMKEIIDRIPEGASQRLYISKDTDSYMQMFLRNYCLRPSCYECIAKEVKTSDLTIADFWGINNVVPEMNDGAGASLVLVRTNKGKSIFESIKMDVELKAVTYEESVKNNSAEFKSCDRPIQRNMFFGDMNGMSFEELAKKYNMEVLTMVGFLDGINESLKVENPIEELEDTTEVSLEYDPEKLYKNMVDAKADWLYNLEEWDNLLTPERRKELYKEQKLSGTVIKEKKVGRNDPCPCGSGKKYKYCCGR